MLRTLVAAGALTVALTVTPALAQQQPPPADQAETNLVGLPVYTSDGQKLGEVLEAATVGGQRMLRAEIGTFLGIGSSPVLIPVSMFAHKVDRIEVAMTADEVRATITRQKPPKQ